MRNDREASGIRIICFVMFLAFTFCWLFLQRDLLVFAVNSFPYYSKRTTGLVSYLYVFVLLIFIVLSAIPVIRLLFKFRNGQYSCNFAVSAFLLGCLTGFDGERFFPQNATTWIVGVSFLFFFLIVLKIASFINRSASSCGSRTVASNLLIMSLLFCLTAYMGNTDENIHRRLRMEKLVAKGDYVKALTIGIDEEETEPEITLLRVKAMLGLDHVKPGTGVGEHLFLYPIADADVLTDSLESLVNDPFYDSRSLQIALAMLESDVVRADSLIVPLISNGFIPEYYMQLLVLSENSEAAESFPDEFEAERKKYTSFCEVLAPLKGESPQVQANATYLEYHTTYFWYYTFK